jgi:hypothetical protein
MNTTELILEASKYMLDGNISAVSRIMDEVQELLMAEQEKNDLILILSRMAQAAGTAE